MASKAMLRLLSYEARVVIVGEVTNGGGSFPLAMEPQLVGPEMILLSEVFLMPTSVSFVQP